MSQKLNREYLNSKNKSGTQPIDFQFAKYDINYNLLADKITYRISIPLFLFALLALAWEIPFPYLKFLGGYNGFFNWASFLIAFFVYYYYQLSARLSYVILLILFAFSYGVMELESWHSTDRPALWMISLVILILSAFMVTAKLKINGKKPTFTEALWFLILSPLWLLRLLFKKK